MKLYDQIVAVTEDYLGPATPRFLNRISMNHLGKPATQLTQSDLPEMITWIKMAANILSENTAEVQALIKKLSVLTKAEKQGKKTSGSRMSAAQ
jgi:hypothetical protein